MNDWLEYVDENGFIIHFGKLFKLYLRNIWAIVLAVSLFGGAAFAYSTFFITPLYKSSIKMYVHNSTNTSDATSITSADISASQNLVDTYAVVLTSKSTLNAVINQTGVDYTYEELYEMISTASINDTEIFRVTVTSSDPEEAADLANAIAEVAPDVITEIVSGSSVKIIEEASVPVNQSSPDRSEYALKGGMAGFIISVVAILLVSLFKNGMSVEDQIRRIYVDKAVLSVIPYMGANEKRKGRKKAMEENAELCENLSFASSESYKLLRENLNFCFEEEQLCRIIGVTSSLRAEGKTTTAINLAYTLAMTRQKVCLIDCDFRLPSIAKRLGLDRTPGMTNFLVSKSDNSKVIQAYHSDLATFYFISSGDIPPNPSELLGSKRMRNVLDALRESFDYVILDLPPIGIVSDALTISKSVDGLLFVVREDFYERRMLSESLRALENANIKLLGMVVTHSTTQKKEYKKYGYKYGYGYGYGEENKTVKEKGKGLKKQKRKK